MENIVIRKAKIEELKTIQELNHKLFIHDEEYDLMLNMNWTFEKVGETYFKDRIAGEKGVCFAAEIDKEVVGYLVGKMIKAYPYRKIKKQSELENMLVKEEYRETINRNRNLVLTSSHPSPYSANYFFGNHHFSKCNEYLKKHKLAPIDWR